MAIRYEWLHKLFDGVGRASAAYFRPATPHHTEASEHDYFFRTRTFVLNACDGVESVYWKVRGKLQNVHRADETNVMLKFSHNGKEFFGSEIVIFSNIEKL